MRPLRVVILVSLMPLAGCQAEREVFDTDQQHELRVAMVQMMNNVAIDNGVIAQRTVYPYHFAADGAEFNDLGERDLEILATHFKTHAGQIGVRRGAASEALYAQRLDAVREYMVAAGVDLNRVMISDALPGGPGHPSEEVINILTIERQAESGLDGAGMNTSLAEPSEGGRYVGTK